MRHSPYMGYWTKAAGSLQWMGLYLEERAQIRNFYSDRYLLKRSTGSHLNAPLRYLKSRYGIVLMDSATPLSWTSESVQSINPIESHSFRSRLKMRVGDFISGCTPDAEGGKCSQVDQKAQQFLSAAENADIGLWFWDLADDKIYSTPRCNELFDVPAYQQLTFDGSSRSSIRRPRIRNQFLSSVAEDGRKYEDEFRVQYSDGSVDWIFAEGKSILGADGVPQKMMGVVRKITEEKLAAAELSRVNELAKRSRDEAIEANRSKDFFLAFVSHEIRSSLNAIIGWSRILLTKEVDNETRQNALETIERSARSQTKLINDLVDSARVASGKLRLEYRPIDICEVVRGAVEAHRPAAETAGIAYSFTSDIEQLSILGDSARLQQVFGNLISNALKFTPAGGTIAVSLTTGAEAVTIDVIDTGAGISASALPGVFRQFSQVESGNFGGNTGLGLGLSIVRY